MTESKPREFLLKKKERQTIDADYNAIEAHPESECDPKDVEAEKILKYIRVIEKSAYDQLQSELKAKDELLRECNQFLNYHLITCRFNYVDDKCTCGLLELKDKLREGKNA